MTTTSPRPAARPRRLRPGCGPADLAGLASVGLRTRKLRAALSALGIAIGVAAIVAVLGLAASSQAALLAEISALGTNLLTVTNGQTFTGQHRRAARRRAGDDRPAARRHRRAGHRQRQQRQRLRSPRSSPRSNTNALTVDAASLGLPAVAGTAVAQGSYLNAATAREPVAVLGAAAAQRLGIDRVWPGMRIWARRPVVLRGRHPQPGHLAPEIDSSVLVGFPAAEKYLGFDGHPSEIYVRTAEHPGRHHRRRQPARRAGQPGKPQPGQRLPALGRADRPGRRQGRARHPVPRPGRGRAAGRRGRGGQHHGHLRPGTPLRRSGCAARWAPPAARSAPSSWPRPSCCPWPAAPPASSSAPPPPPSTPTPRAGPSSSRPKPGPAAWPPPCSSAPSPGCCPPSAPPACPHPGALEHLTGSAIPSAVYLCPPTTGSGMPTTARSQANRTPPSKERLMTSLANDIATPMAAEQRAKFERDGFL